MAETWGGELRARGGETPGAVPAPPADAPEWWNVLQRFRTAAADFERRFGELRALAEYARTRPALRADYEALARRATELRERVATIGQHVQQAIDWLRSFGLGSLGALPLAPLLAVGGVAAVAYFAAQLTDAARDIGLFLLRVNEARRLESAGVAPERAAELASEAARSARGRTDWIPLLVALGVVGLGVWWFMQQRGRRGG